MSSSSSSPRTWRYDVFTSFRGKDVRYNFISHLLKQLSSSGITVFIDQELPSGQPLSDLLTTIREAKISIIVFSKNYASSEWCLTELLEILECEKDMGQIVMPIFFGVDRFDVRKQTGEFGIAFNKMCARKTEEEIRKWSQALDYVGNIVGEHILNWDNESDMVEKIARDVSNKLNAASSTNNLIGENKSQCCTGVAIFVVINLLLEIVAAVADQLSSINKLYFARISLVMSIISVLLSIIEVTYKIRAHEARFQCKWPIPWFYYPSLGYDTILGSLPYRVLLFCAVGQLIVSAINCVFIELGQDGLIKVAVMPLFFAIAMVGSKFMEKPTISNDNSCNQNVMIDLNFNE